MYWSLGAIERDSLRAYLLCGLGIGLAASAKTPGAFGAIPVLCLTAFEPLRRSRWIGLAAAGITSALVFVAVNGSPFFYLRYTRYQYEFIAAHRPDVSPWTMLGKTVSAALDPVFHGPVLGVVALAGLGGLAVRLFSPGRPWSERLRLAVFLSFPVGFTLVVMLVSDLPKGNFFLPLVPFSALGAAWLLVLGWRRISGGLGAGRRRVLGWSATVLLVALSILPSWRYLYRSRVTATTLGQIARYIASTAPMLNHSLVIHEAGIGELRPERLLPDRHTVAVVQTVPALVDLPQDELDRADYEVFAESRLHGPERHFHLSRITRVGPEQAAIFLPRLLAVRGTAQVLLIHRWELDGATLPIAWRQRARPGTRRLAGVFPAEVAPSEIVSLDLAFAAGSDEAVDRDCELAIRRQPLEIFRYGTDAGKERWMTKRFRLPRARAAVRLRCTETSDHLARLTRLDAVRWQPAPKVEVRRPVSAAEP